MPLFCNKSDGNCTSISHGSWERVSLSTKDNNAMSNDCSMNVILIVSKSHRFVGK